MNGVINIYKEKGCSSFHIVYVLRKLSGEQKVGHTGTLDPDVTGVLPVCIGKATKLVGQLTDTDKTYRCTMLLGRSTDTQDAGGAVLEEMSRRDVEERLGKICLSSRRDTFEELITDSILSFVGDIQQIPPMYSALKVGGMKLVNAARKGVEVERKPRTVTIRSITDISVDMASLTASFTVECSKGTYIRTLCEDIGKMLSIPACMLSLERTRAAGMDISTAVTLDQAAEYAAEGTLEAHLTPADRFLEEYDALTVCEESVRKLIYGNYLFYSDMCRLSADVMKSAAEGQIFRLYDEKGEFYALYNYDRKLKCVKCVKMFRDID
ncbi:MAG: tRNA pseudouridine(55) synthase TruB [Parasporobacterium sp.]|nr:tRNA pseudouridine(55) synthase TruB [Parasporobacterium sp.]